jgi:hypothetical protein
MVFEPAMLGSVFKAVTAGFEKIGIIDGYFGNNPSIWHKEILYALGSGASIYGSSSIGALRAAELYPYGMRGVGGVFRSFARGELTDDDEVCVLHSIRELGFVPLTEALVNTRATLRRLSQKGLISSFSVQQVLQALKSVHFSRRTRAQILEFLARYGACVTEKVYARNYVDSKSDDAQQLLRCLKDDNLPGDAQAARWFFETRFWTDQFVNQLGDIPDLLPWVPTVRRR